MNVSNWALTAVSNDSWILVPSLLQFHASSKVVLWRSLGSDTGFYSKPNTKKWTVEGPTFQPPKRTKQTPREHETMRSPKNLFVSRSVQVEIGAMSCAPSTTILRWNSERGCASRKRRIFVGGFLTFL